jgi:hypothetical protein
VTPEAHNDLVGVTGSVSPVAAGQWPDRRPGGALVRGIRAAARAPFTARARRELLFCAVAAPLGLCVLVVPVALTGLPLTVTSLAHGTHPAHRQAQPAWPVAFLGPAVLLVLLALLVLAPRIARRLTAVHRRLAGRLPALRPFALAAGLFPGQAPRCGTAPAGGPPDTCSCNCRWR